MLVPEQYRECIFFLCLPDDDVGWTPVGSGFFVLSPVGPDFAVPFLVTARHVVEGARASGKQLYVRLNRRDAGKADFLEAPAEAWVCSEETDVAAFHLDDDPRATYAIEFIRPSQIATAEQLAERNVGPGDEVFFAGLFSGFPGVERVEPLIRFGNISMMPGEPVSIQNADGSRARVEAFLVEARSWGGQSGSPAFVFFPATRQPGFLEIPEASEGPEGKLAIPDTSMPQLLGLVQGHFNLSTDVAFRGDAAASAHVSINAGVAIVIPAPRIVDHLEGMLNS
jgi:hypothetical protein